MSHPSGETHLRLKNLEAAKKFLLMAREYPNVTADDAEAIAKAKELLKKNFRE